MNQKCRRRIRLFHMRRRFLIGFFCATLLFAILVFGFGFFLEKSGVSIRVLHGHAIGMLMLSTLCAVIVSGFSYVMVKRMFRSLEQLNQAARKITKGDYSVHVNYSGHVTDPEL